MLKKLTIIVIFMLGTAFSYGQTNFSRGEELLMRNQPAQAVSFLESSISEDPANAKAYLYLGVVYEQLGRMDEAIAVYRRILPSAGNLSALVANNLGNVYFQRGNNDEAERYYSQAISTNSSFPGAYLGRANTRIKNGDLTSAVSDYERYLVLEPASSQRANIERLVNLIRTEAAAEETRKLLAAEEARRLAEERERLLESVSASLQSAADSSQALSSGAENVEQYEGEFVLE